MARINRVSYFLTSYTFCWRARSFADDLVTSRGVVSISSSHHTARNWCSSFGWMICFFLDIGYMIFSHPDPVLPISKSHAGPSIGTWSIVVQNCSSFRPTIIVWILCWFMFLLSLDLCFTLQYPMPTTRIFTTIHQDPMHPFFQDIGYMVFSISHEYIKCLRI